MTLLQIRVVYELKELLLIYPILAPDKVSSDEYVKLKSAGGVNHSTFLLTEARKSRSMVTRREHARDQELGGIGRRLSAVQIKAIQEIQQLIGPRPMVFDREFSYRDLLNSLVDEDVHFVIRLNIGANPPHFYYDAERKQHLQLLVAPINKPQIYQQVYYMGEVCLNMIGIWRYGFKEPMWIITNMDPEAGLALCNQRMKIEICFRDLKSLLHIDKVMNKSQVYLNKMLAMVMLAYAITLIVGEAIRDVQYAQVMPRELDLLTVPSVDKRSRWYSYSGPSLLVKQRYRLQPSVLRLIVKSALLIFAQLVFANVRILVRT